MKYDPNQKILAHNFMNFLLVINGEFDSVTEVPNDFDNQNWEHAGEYNSYGVFCLRLGEHK